MNPYRARPKPEATPPANWWRRATHWRSIERWERRAVANKALELITLRSPRTRRSLRLIVEEHLNKTGKFYSMHQDFWSRVVLRSRLSLYLAEEEVQRVMARVQQLRVTGTQIEC